MGETDLFEGGDRLATLRHAGHERRRRRRVDVLLGLLGELGDADQTRHSLLFFAQTFYFGNKCKYVNPINKPSAIFLAIKKNSNKNVHRNFFKRNRFFFCTKFHKNQVTPFTCVNTFAKKRVKK